MTNTRPNKTLSRNIQIAPGDRFIREPETLAITGLSKSQRHKLMNQVDDHGIPNFPRKYSLSDRARAWLLSDVMSWMEKRIASSTPTDTAAREG